MFEDLSLDTASVDKLKKSIYRAVDLIELCFPDPKNRHEKIKLGPYQKDFIDSIQFGFPITKLKYKEVDHVPMGVIFVTRRQVGKSIGLAYAFAALMIIGTESRGAPPTYCGMVAASEEESQLLIDKVKYALEYSPFKDYIADVKVNKITLTNGSTCTSHTHSSKSVKGPSYDFIGLDESAMMDEEIFFEAAIPTVEHGERWVAITTPKGDKGTLIEYRDKALRERPIICKKCGRRKYQNEFHKVTFPVRGNILELPDLPNCKCGANDYKYGVGTYAIPYLDPWTTPIIDQDKLKRKLDAHNWSPWARQELLGEILSEASMVILNEWIENCISLRERNVMNKKPDTKYILGVDYGRRHDASSFCITHYNKKKEKIILDYMRTVSGEYDYQTDYEGIKKHLRDVAEYWQPYLIVPDATGLGDPQVEQLQKDLRFWNVRTQIYRASKQYLGFKIKASNKQDLIGNLITKLSKAELVMPPRTEPEIDELCTEMLRFECEVMERGYIKYGTQNYHDDRIIALALSLWGHRGRKHIRPHIRSFNYGMPYDAQKKRGNYKHKYFKVF